MLNNLMIMYSNSMLPFSSALWMFVSYNYKFTGIDNNGSRTGTDYSVISSPEHEVLRMSYCDHAVSVVRRTVSVFSFLPCVLS